MAPAPVDEASPAAAAPGPGRRLARSGWIPAALTVAGAVFVLSYYGVPPVDLAKFAAYRLIVIVVPGTLAWRALRGGGDGLVPDVAAGSALGYALEVLAYLPARAIGQPRLALAVPAAVLIAFVAVPRLRRFWRGPGDRVPTWWAWLVSAAVVFLLVWSAATFYRGHGLTWPGNGSPYIDMTYHLALAGEARHHVPPVVPYVRGEPLNYHWFVYADVAATNATTGVELQTLLYRLSMLPMLALLTVLIAVLARRITGRWWTGPVAVGFAYAATVASPYPWLSTPVSSGNGLGFLWVSPTQTFGALLFAPVVLLLVELCRGEATGRPRWGPWVLLAVLLATLTGAKATFLPIVLAALLLVVVAGWLTTRRLNRPALVGLVLTAAALAFAQLVLFAGSNGGLVVDPLYTARAQPVVTATGLAGPRDRAFGPSLTAVLICVIGWTVTWAGAFGLLARRRGGADPARWLLLGIGLAGVGALITFRHPGGSQVYFFQSARPYLGLLAVSGLAAALPAGRPTGRTAWLLVGAGLAGGLAVWVLRAASDPTAPTLGSTGGRAALMVALLWPYAVLAAAAALLYAGLHAVGQRVPSRAGTALAATLVFVTGFGLVASATFVKGPIRSAVVNGWRAEPRPDAAGEIRTGIPDGAVEAGRWLRDHSSAADVVATNAHCYNGVAPCSNRHFWISGYAERRVLVEGWGYTGTALRRSEETGVPHGHVPYWDPDLLAANDRVFSAPSAEAVTFLRDAYGVRWLFVDRRFNPPAATLDSFATLRFEAGDCAVYEIPR
jgi:hypothetical protein